MLVELSVENYAVIERLRIRFHRGLNVLTGETGSGKSIVVDSLDLLFGGRASAEMVRTGAAQARISGIFEVAARHGLVERLEQAGIVLEDGELLIEREVLAGGKSRAYVASRPVTAGLLRELAPWLGDIHGQHEQQRLFEPAAQLEMLDAFAGAQALQARAGELYREWASVRDELAELERNSQENLRLADLWRFQTREIDEAELKPGEDDALAEERQVLMNVTRLEENATAAYEALYEAPESALSVLRQAGRKLEEAGRFDAHLQSIRETLRPAEIAVDEAAHALMQYLGRLEADPARLEDIEARLAKIEKLKRKYGATIDAVLGFLEETRAQLDRVEHFEGHGQKLRERQERAARAFEKVAGELSGQRREAAAMLARKVEQELAGLAMERTVFEVRLTAAEWSEWGTDAATFLISPNVGEEPKPLARIASGGELSRIALALKTCLAGDGRKSETPRTVVFDEVDAGVGGAAAEMVGKRLKRLSATQQVLCVTHLAQIAGFADHHYAVEKRALEGRTVATVEELTGDARTREIGRMLSGQKLTPEALKHAEQLIRSGSRG